MSYLYKEQGAKKKCPLTKAEKAAQSLQYLKAARGMQEDSGAHFDLERDISAAKRLLSMEIRPVNEVRSDLASTRHASERKIKQFKLESEKMDAVIENAKQYQKYLADQVDLEFLKVKKLEAELAQSEELLA